MAKIHYITSWYPEKNPERMVELQICVQNCINSPDIDSVHLLCEGEAMYIPDENDCTHKLIQEQKSFRPTYNTFFEYANSIAEEGDIVICANTDIYPELGSRELLQQLRKNECFALSRWDVDKNNVQHLFDRRDSQDVWCFRAPISRIDADFCTGLCGCDNRIAFLIQEAGYDVRNPARTIKFNHLHNSGVRNYDRKTTIPAPYHLIPTSSL